LLLNVLVDAGVLRPRPASFRLHIDECDYPLRVITETIGEDRLKLFAARFLGPAARDCRVDFVRPPSQDIYLLLLSNEMSGSVLLEDRKYPLLPGHMIWTTIKSSSLRRSPV
jgi:hypothetical protein